MKERTAVLLINLGTPDSPSVRHVRSYLSQFLNDPRVIDIPWVLRKILVNLIIVPFRAPKSAKIYSQLWTENGSPLLYNSMMARDLLQAQLGEPYQVFLAMRYKSPSIPHVLNEIYRQNFDHIIVLPMFPHYASASTGSAHDEVMRVVRSWWRIPKVTFISQYYDHPDFIGAFAERGRELHPDAFDHVVFSYHGLPERQVNRIHEDKPCSEFHCDSEINDHNHYCYRAACFATSRLLAAELRIPKEKYTVSFQSRLDDKWLKPFSDHVIKSLAESGKEKVLVFSPAFTADCLETIIEIGVEYRDTFRKSGGKLLEMVPSLNDHPRWISCMADLVRRSV